MFRFGLQFIKSLYVRFDTTIILFYIGNIVYYICIYLYTYDLSPIDNISGVKNEKPSDPSTRLTYHFIQNNHT